MYKDEFKLHVNKLIDELKIDNDFKKFLANLSLDKLNLNKSNEIVIFQFNGLGDNILLSSFLRNVYLNNKGKKITLVCNEKTKDLYEYCPYITRLVTISHKSPHFVDCLEDIFNCLYTNFWDYAFELALAPQWDRTNFMAMLMSYFIKADKKVGFSVNAYRSCYLDDPPEFYNDPVDFDTLFTDPLYAPLEVIHNIDRKKFILEYLNYKVDNMYLETWLSKEDEEYAASLLKTYDAKFITIGLGGVLKSKRYPIDLLSKALYQIQKDNPNIMFVILGDKDDIDAANMLSALKCISLVNKTTLRQSIALIKYCKLYIGNDTVTSHMASIFKLPEIVIFMEAKDKQHDVLGYLSSIAQFKPYTDKLIIIQPEHSLDICKEAHIHGGCCYNEPHCITSIDPSQIVNAFNELKSNL